jgi:hypothetical protein
MYTETELLMNKSLSISVLLEYNAASSGNLLPTLHYTPEEHVFHQRRGGSLKSWISRCQKKKQKCELNSVNYMNIFDNTAKE